MATVKIHIHNTFIYDFACRKNKKTNLRLQESQDMALFSLNRLPTTGVHKRGNLRVLFSDFGELILTARNYYRIMNINQPESAAFIPSYFDVGNNRTTSVISVSKLRLFATVFNGCCSLLQRLTF